MESTIIVALISAVATVFNVVFTTLSSRKTEQAARKAAEEAEKCKEDRSVADELQCLLRAEIIRTHAKYTEKKFCPVWARENLIAIHDAYKGLGGNHIGDDMFNEVMALPYEPPKEDEE